MRWRLLAQCLYASMFDLTIVGSKMYGAFPANASNPNGYIFSTNLDGSNCQTIYSFTGTGPDGSLRLAA